MAKSKVYDLKISIDNGTLTMQAYKLKLDTEGYFTTDKEIGRAFTRKLDKRNKDVIGYLLDLEEWDTIRTYWDGYVDWQDSSYLLVGDTPEPVAKWFEGLPEYKIVITAKEVA